jgi:signal peptidase I
LIRRLLLLVLVAVGGAWLVRTFLFEGVYVASGSMEPTLSVGTHYFVNKMAYRFHPPLRGDIIVFKSPVDAQKGLIKRVIALPGDRVELRSKQVYLNGQALTEPYTIYKRASERLVGDNIQEMTVPPDRFFVLGDNRDESEDSSDWKDPQTHEPVRFIEAGRIDGKLVIP